MNRHQRIVIFNRAALSSSGGWIHIVPKGELPNKEAGIVQVLDDTSLDAILAGIEKDKNRLGDKWPGIYAGREHFIYDSDKDSAALAWFKDFEKRGDGIWAKEDGLTPAGALAVQNREYKFTSFVADPADLEKVGEKKYRVKKIETVGFTNYANGKELLNPITNRIANELPPVPADKRCPDCGCALVGGKTSALMSCPDCKTNFAVPRGPADSTATKTTEPVKNKQMKTVCTLLGLSAEADEQSVHAAVTKLLNRADVTPAEFLKLQNQATDLAAQNQTLLGEQVEGIFAERKITDAKIKNRLTPILTPLKTREERLEALTELGFKGEASGASVPASRVLNRGGAAAAVAHSAADNTDEQVKVAKIKNRADELASKGGKYSDAFSRATREFHQGLLK